MMDATPHGPTGPGPSDEQPAAGDQLAEVRRFATELQ
jgi:hypothetical protein